MDEREMLKRMVELVQPDLRKYYRMPRKGRIEAAYASENGTWFADVQPLRNDESVDPNEPVLPKLELPVVWGGVDRGQVCPPAAGTYCIVGYLDGDPSYPFIMHIRWYNQQPPHAELTEYVLQQEPGVFIKIDKEHRHITVTPTDIVDEAGRDWTVEVGNNAVINVGNTATIKAPLINIIGDQVSTGHDGGIGTAHERDHRTHDGSYTLNGPQTVNGNIVVSGTVTAAQFIGPVAGCNGCGG
jgi:Uncharacterized protein conserved in bacteria